MLDSEMRAAYRDEQRHGDNPYIFFYDANLELLTAPPWKQPGIKNYFQRYEEQR